MKILVLNGSPRGNKSNTMKITNKFIEGLNSVNENQIQIVNIKERNIDHCLGCFSCWTKTSGKCIIKDDMDSLINEYIDSDLIVWSFPLYYFGMPSKIKSFMDRLLPLNLPYMDKEKNNGVSHVARYDLNEKKYLLISTCGFHSIENNYEALLKQFQILCGENLETIICPQGEILNVEELRAKTDEYLLDVYNGAKEYATEYKFSKSIKEKLSKPFFSPETYIEMANNSWDIDNEIKTSKAEKLLRQMKTLYNPKMLSKDELVIIEFEFIDIKEKYQLLLNSEKCEMIKENFTKYSIKIITTFDLWEKISKGIEKGDEALMSGKYKVLGNMEIMMKFNAYFGQEKRVNDKKEFKTNMNLFFLPWIGFWTVINFNNQIAGILAITTSMIVSLLAFKYKLTIYDRLSMIFSSIFGIFSLLNFENKILYALSFMVLGTIWLYSLFQKYSLTSEYSVNKFDDAKMKDNLIFLKTNKILTALWVVVYYLMGALSLLQLKGYEKLVLNNMLPLIMLGFTGYFAKEYPKFLMKKNVKMENII